VFGGHGGRFATGSILRTLLLLAASTEAFAGDEVSFPDLQGVYLSSRLRGCSLELGGNGDFTLNCPSEQHHGKAVTLGRGFLIPARQATKGIAAEPPGQIVLPQPSLPTSAATWPPSVSDPTAGPYVIDREVQFRNEMLWLQPLHWGQRLYLIPIDGHEAFCREIKSGVEPRQSAMGEEFLRRGDHRKPAPRRPPSECRAFKK